MIILYGLGVIAVFGLIVFFVEIKNTPLMKDDYDEDVDNMMHP